MRRSVLLLLPFAVLPPVLRPLAAQTPVTFLGVALDADTRRADEKLRRYLEGAAGLSFVSERALDYRTVIDRLVAWQPGRAPFLARVTPYALVAAELLGADMQIMATYESRATGATTYRSYFVVNRARFPYQPELSSMLRYLREAPTPRTFAYHSEFSTSSFFLPALYFRRNDIYDMPQSNAHEAAIRIRRFGSSSADLVGAVARGEYDFAAVWSGTKAQFENERRVAFIELPTLLPNDLLVASSQLDSVTVARIRRAIDAMPPHTIDEGDFLGWRDFNAAAEARTALADLRWLARGQPAASIIEVRGAGGLPDDYLHAVRQAVRLAGPEFVNYDPDFHLDRDYVWTVQPIHDGAVRLVSHIIGFDVADQQFELSFRDAEDLTRRVGTAIKDRLHRLRYVWPYRADPPTVLRDVDFALPAGSPVRVRRLRWVDISRDAYVQDAELAARIAHSDFYKFELAPSFIAPPDDEGFGFNPMSNISYRVVLERVEHERSIFRILTVALLVLMVLAAAAAGADLRRLLRGRRDDSLAVSPYAE